MKLAEINYLGAGLGVLMLLLPFLGPWWIVEVGDGAFHFETSPFELNVRLAGMPLESPLIGLFLLATKISFLIGGTFVLLASIFPKSWWARKLFRFGVMKPLWSVVGLVITIVVGTFLVNNVLPNFLSSMAGSSVVQSLNIPYFQGGTAAAFQIGPATITAPVKIFLGGGFWAGVVASAIGIGARVYQKKLAPKEETTAKK
ncbi:MAG: hypothetical protein QXG38_03475 [Candidatus Hadarchaeales archaeon]